MNEEDVVVMNNGKGCGDPDPDKLTISFIGDYRMFHVSIPREEVPRLGKLLAKWMKKKGFDVTTEECLIPWSDL